MNEDETRSGGQSESSPPPTERKGIGCGVFLIIVGLGLMAERMGWVPFSTVWFLPAVFIAWGIGMIYDAIANR